MMRTFHWVLISLSLTACASKSPYALSSLSYSPEELKKTGRTIASVDSKKENKSYLAMELPYAPFEKLRHEVEQSQHVSLQHRGEAHITIVTPPEYKKIHKKLSMKEIDALAAEMGLQKSPYKLLCVGKGSVKDQSTYYAVVESDRLFQIRRAIQMLYTSKGGKAEDFNPEAFYPHVTLGFTHKDLHAEDGVVKDASSCIYSLRPEEKAKN